MTKSENVPSDKIVQVVKQLYPSSPEKRKEFYDAVAGLSHTKIKQVIHLIRRHPDLPIGEIMKKVLGEIEHVVLRIKFSVASSEGLLKAVNELKRTPTQIVTQAVNKWLKDSGFVGRGGRPPLRRQNQKRRTPDLILADILGFCAHGVKQSELLKKANLCHNDMKEYTKKLLEDGMIKTETATVGWHRGKSVEVKVFKTTEKGYKWLQQFKILQHMGSNNGDK